MMDLIVTYPSLARNKFKNKNPLRLLMENAERFVFLGTTLHLYRITVVYTLHTRRIVSNTVFLFFLYILSVSTITTYLVHPRLRLGLEVTPLQDPNNPDHGSLIENRPGPAR